MTNKFFKVTVCYDKPVREGEMPQSNKPEAYLVDAMSFTEAEARIIKEITPYSIGGIEVKAVNKSSISEIVKNPDPSADYWYRARVDFITLDNDREKRCPAYYLVKGVDFKDALACLENEALKGICADCEIVSLAETAIVDVFEYEPEKASADGV